jgi:hypothetical protein
VVGPRLLLRRTAPKKARFWALQRRERTRWLPMSKASAFDLDHDETAARDTATAPQDRCPWGWG